MEAGHGQRANSAWTGTLGTAPNGVHLLYWASLVPAGESFERAGFNFALALYENGEAEVIVTSGRKVAPVKAVAGVLSAQRRT